MAGQTFSDIYTAAQNVSPSQITAARAKTLSNQAYQYVLRMREWFGFRKYTTFATVPDKSAGTITLTINSQTVTGVGTAFAASDVGRYLSIGTGAPTPTGGQRNPIRISAVANATSLTLEQAWGESTLAAIGYLIYSLRYVLPSDAEKIIQLRGPIWPLSRRSPALVDSIDPSRRTRGNGLLFYEAERRSDGTREYEMWPIPQDASGVTYTLVYKLFVPNMVADADTPVLAAEAVMRRAQAEVCRELFNRTGEQTFLTAASAYDADFDKIMDPIIREDRRLRGPHPVALDSDTAVDPNTAGFREMMRMFNSLSLTNIA